MSVNTASVVWPLRPPRFHLEDDESGYNPFHRPIPIRTRTFSQSSPIDVSPDEHRSAYRSRFKSIPADENLSPRKLLRSTTELDSPRTSLEEVADPALASFPTSPSPTRTSTNQADSSSKRTSLEANLPDILPYDFSKVDYELQRAKVLGQGLWSTVFLAEHKSPEAGYTPTTPHRRSQSRTGPSLFAVKIPGRRDAKEVFHKEARVLSHLQRRKAARHYIVPFYGLDTRNDSLVFEAVIGGSLESLTSRLKQMAELTRHLEIVNLFPSLASDLIAGLEFLHSAGVVHADIKPANILLDISHNPFLSSGGSGGGGAPVVRARYIDFSAAFIPHHPTDPLLASPSNAGGTWDFMAPEQLRIQPDLNTPTPASDVWSLGITLLTVLVGASPYADAVPANNLFMLREAIKAGDPLGFARADPVARKRLAAGQDYVDCLRLALKKDRDIRVTAAAWRVWVEEREMGIQI